eukprot:TRINITY_DN7330_c0_g2_i2.p1 TRINITY_DN7330_c0_g2~~TRINITY_DN7330_c0_g2_i2.p1  ORF type:complete len:141 (+),score=11.25 TRINITY_DN7330_c0_g2_i2:211-633(+)
MLKLSKTIKNMPLSIVLSIAKSLELTEIEIALWSLHIEFAKWELQQFQLCDCILFAAVVAKQQLCGDPKLLKSCFYRVFALDPSLVKKYQDWSFKYPIRLTFSAAQINLQFSMLRNVMIYDTVSPNRNCKPKRAISTMIW